jgi:hypothetical protein
LVAAVFPRRNITDPLLSLLDRIMFLLLAFLTQPRFTFSIKFRKAFFALDLRGITSILPIGLIAFFGRSNKILL